MKNILEGIKESASKYKIEVILLVTALSICLLSLLVYLNTSIYPVQSLQTTLPEKIRTPPLPDIIYVEIAGAVHSPGVYALNKGNRIQALIETAGGTTTDANQAYLDLHLNRALLLSDQQKIFIPRTADPIPTFTTLINSNAQQPDISQPQGLSADLINLNAASTAELEELPSVGPVTAQKIVAGRPYKSIDELVSKKILSASLFSKIKESIYIR